MEQSSSDGIVQQCPIFPSLPFPFSFIWPSPAPHLTPPVLFTLTRPGPGPTVSEVKCG